MNTLSYKTISANSETVEKEWVVIDAKDQVVGRLASQIAFIIRGKHKTNFTPHVDCGDNVIVINAEKIRFTGSKMIDKVYTRHTGYPGGQRFSSPRLMLEKHPIRIMEHAVRGMLPKNRLGRRLFTNLYVYAGDSHPHEGQTPREVTITEFGR